MGFANMTWAYGFDLPVQPLEKFALENLANRMPDRDDDPPADPPILPSMPISELPRIAAYCNLPLDKFERIVEQLMRRGLVRTAPGPSLELCTFIDPREWNRGRKEKAEAATNGNGSGKKKRKK